MPRPEPLPKSPEGPRVEAPLAEHGGGPREDLRGPVGYGRGREAVPGDGTEVVDSGLMTRATLQALVEEEREPEQEVGVEVGDARGHLERLEFEPPRFLRMELDRGC